MGAGGHAKVVADTLKLSGREILGFVTPNMGGGSTFCGKKILGDDSVISKYSPDVTEIVNGVGSLPGKNLRWQLAEKMRKHGYSFVTVIHPNAVIASDVILDEGVQIMAGVVIQAGSEIGKDSIINTGALIDHDCEVAENCHIAPGVVLSGGIVIKKYTHIGTGAKIIQNITVHERCTVAAGTVIYKDIPSTMLVKQKLDTIMEKREDDRA